jgi:hypothetical protein
MPKKYAKHGRNKRKPNARQHLPQTFALLFDIKTL